MIFGSFLGHSWGTGHHFSGGYWLNQQLRLYCLRCPLEIQEFKDSNWMISWKHTRQGSKKGGVIHPPSVVESHFNSTFTYGVVPTIQWVEFIGRHWKHWDQRRKTGSARSRDCSSCRRPHRHWQLAPGFTTGQQAEIFKRKDIKTCQNIEYAA